MLGKSVVLLATGVPYEFAGIKRQLFEKFALKMDFTSIIKAAM